jgi:non-ribosomal peptide synthetase component F
MRVLVTGGTGYVRCGARAAIERRELRQTLADTVRWLAARGIVTARQAGSPAALTCQAHPDAAALRFLC